MGKDHLLGELLRRTPQQPATAYWRAIELGHLLDEVQRLGGLSGLGLDLGCGDGSVMGSLSRRLGGVRVVGVDKDAEEIVRARKTGAYERVHAAPGSSVPEPGGTFDWVLANSVLEHVPNIRAVLAEVSRLLKPAGQLWITVPGPDFHAALAGPGLLAPLLGRGDEYFRRLDRRLQHLRYWSVQEWGDNLQRYGLEVICASSYMASADARRWEFLSAVTAGLADVVAGGDRTGLDIQRVLGISTGSRWNRLLLLPAWAVVLASRLRATPRKPECYAGLLVLAQRA